jgi:hypothetical protein
MTHPALEAAARKAPKRGKAKPSKLTPAAYAAVVGAVRKGSSLSDAARVAGVTHTTVTGWMARAEGRDQPAPSTEMLLFCRAVRLAQLAYAADLFERADAACTIRLGYPLPLPGSPETPTAQ